MATLQQVFSHQSMVSGASVTSSIELPGVYEYVYLVVPGMLQFSADTQIFIQGSADNTTFYRYALAAINTSSVQTNDFVIASGASQKIVNIPNFSCRYLKIETTATVTAPSSVFKIIAVSEQ